MPGEELTQKVLEYKRSGSKELLNDICKETAHYLRPVAKKMHERNTLYSEEDYWVAGLEGAWHAAENFDSERGVPFVSYAKACAKTAMLKWMNEQNRVSGHYAQLEDRIDRVAQEYTALHGYAPSDAYLLQNSYLSREQLGHVRFAMRVSHSQSIESEAYGKIYGSHDAARPDDIVMACDFEESVHGKLAHSPEHIRVLWHAYLFEGCTMDKAAAQAGISKIKGWRILRKGLPAA